MIKLHITPQPKYWPARGGVREHLRQLYKQLLSRNDILLTDNPDEADILHVESAFQIPQTKTYKPVVYVCHGGFVPEPMQVVVCNLRRAEVIISVSNWITKYFQNYTSKTKVIYNGVDLEEIGNIVDPISRSQDTILYAKEWDYYFEDFVKIVQNNPQQKFISTIWPERFLSPPDNVQVIGLQDREGIYKVLRNVGALILTGSEVCPTMLLEAWAMGTLVIAKNIDGSRELMQHGINTYGGMLYDEPSDLREDALRNFWDRRGAMGQEGREEVLRRFQWSNLIDEYVEVYKRLL